MNKNYQPVMLVQVSDILDNPKNEFYFTENTKEEYDILKKSIEENGIRDPLKLRRVGNKFMLIGGRIRLQVARELGEDRVPATIYDDITDDEAEYLLIADNDERRTNDDPIKKAKRDKVLFDYFQKKKTTEPVPKVKEIAAMTGHANKSDLYRSMKLNALIPEFQEMVSSGKLSATAADPFARMSQEDQKGIFKQLGDALEGIKVQEARDLKVELESYKKATKEAQERASKLQNEVEKLKKDNTDGHKLMQKVLDDNNQLQEKMKKLNVVDINKLDPNDPRVKEYNNLMQDIEKNQKALSDLETEKKDREKQIQEAKFELSDLQHNMKELKEKTAKEDKAIMAIRRKVGEPLRSAFGEIKFLLSEVDDDPYGNLITCIKKHLPILQDTMDMLKEKQDNLNLAKLQPGTDTTKSGKVLDLSGHRDVG